MQAAVNALLDAGVTQVIAGVRLEDVCLADNFYTPSKDRYAYWYLVEQVRALAGLSIEFGTPFITGKDSSSGSAVFGQRVINVPPSVCITAMGKIRYARRLKPPKWQAAGNLVFAVGPQASRLDGSILSAALGITGSRLESNPVLQTKSYMGMMARLGRSALVRSAVPVNQGGIIRRLFEGVEASGFGFKSEICAELFPESFGTALVEVRPEDGARLETEFRLLGPMLVGKITRARGLTVQGQRLPWSRLFRAWNTKFAKEVYDEN